MTYLAFGILGFEFKQPTVSSLVFGRMQELDIEQRLAEFKSCRLSYAPSP